MKNNLITKVLRYRHFNCYTYLSTMKKIFCTLLLLVVFISCDKKSEVEKKVEEIPLELTVERFDKEFFETKPEDLDRLKKKYPAFFPEEVEDTVWINKMRHPLWRELYSEVQKTFGDFSAQKDSLENLFRYIKYYYPETRTPKIVTLIYEMDYSTKAIYADSIVLISLEMYLGKDHKFYEFPAYQKQNFTKKQILPDLVSSFAMGKIPPPRDNTFLSQMIYAGKELYMKDLLLADYSDADKIGYTPEQIAFCEENETYMWSYFIEEKLLYSTDSRLPMRFLNPAPFSKFYLEIDNDTPGRVGAWIGWQIVRAYMDHNKVTLQQMLLEDAGEIFNKSKYKPRKNG
jgi:gliding motility-associated lipoprotein GldB